MHIIIHNDYCTTEQNLHDKLTRVRYFFYNTCYLHTHMKYQENNFTVKRLTKKIRMYLNITHLQCCISILSTETLKDVVRAIFGTRRSTDANVRCSLKLNVLTEKKNRSVFILRN